MPSRPGPGVESEAGDEGTPRRAGGGYAAMRFDRCRAGEHARGRATGRQVPALRPFVAGQREGSGWMPRHPWMGTVLLAQRSLSKLPRAVSPSP